MTGDRRLYTVKHIVFDSVTSLDLSAFFAFHSILPFQQHFCFSTQAFTVIKMPAFLDLAAQLAIYKVQWDAYAAQLDGTTKVVRLSTHYFKALGPIGEDVFKKRAG